MQGLEKILEDIDDYQNEMEESGIPLQTGWVKNIIRKHMNDGWIPVEKQLPEPGRIVIVHQCYSWENFEDYACVTIGRISPDTLHWEFQYYRPNFERGTIMDNDIICPGNEYVIAWRPLPEPYRSEQTVVQRPEWQDRMLHTFLGGRRLLENARDVPALRIGRRYREMVGGEASGQKNTEAVPGAEEGAGADRPGNRAPAGAGGEHSDGDGEGHRLQP